MTLALSGKLAVHRYATESGLVTEFWWKQPDGSWVLKGHYDGFGKQEFLDGRRVDSRSPNGFLELLLRRSFV